MRVGVLASVLTAAAAAESAGRAVWAPGTIGHDLMPEPVRVAVASGSHAAPVSAAGQPGSMLVIVLLVLVGVFTTGPLVFLGPSGAAATIVIAAIASLLLFHLVTAAGTVALLIALYRLGHKSVVAPALGVPFLALALAGTGLRYAILLAAGAPAAGFAGVALRERRAAASRAAAAEDLTGSLLEHTARGERARIARELHDVVAHHISMVAVQAESARLTTSGMPPAGAQRLLDIGDTARAALTEMRRLLGVLREDAAAEVADRRPQPGLAQLVSLLDESRGASGTGARLIVSGSVTPLDPGVELAAYRIVQEALTNARRHAPGAAVDVELRYTDDGLWLRIRDNGPGPPPFPPGNGPTGHGLTGMRERAVAAGGELRCGAASGGGFLIEATLPGKAET